MTTQYRERARTEWSIDRTQGALPSRAWAEAVDDAYERGLCLCAAVYFVFRSS